METRTYRAMRGFHALKMSKNTASSGINLSVKRLTWVIYTSHHDLNIDFPSANLGAHHDRQRKLPCHLQTVAGAEVMVVTCTLHESLSQPFFIELEVYEHCIAMKKITHKDMLEGDAQITLWQGKKPIRHLHGIIYQLEV